MTGTDRALAALVLLLAAAASTVKPLWRELDPGPANLLLAHEVLRTRGDLDPWGVPWIRTYPARAPLTVRSSGPDKRFGTSDDVVFVLRHHHGLTEEATTYRTSPGIPITIALILLLMRWLSCAARPRASLRERAIVAGALAILPTTLTLMALTVTDAWRPVLESRSFVRPLSPKLGVAGSIYVLFAAATFVLRDLRD